MSVKSQNEAAQQAAEKIVHSLNHRFSRGLVITEETLFFAESTYGINADELAEVLADESFEDRYVLLELMLFPDHETRMSVEQIIYNSALAKAQEPAIVKSLVGSIDSLLFYTRDRRISFWLSVPETVLASLVAKLYLTRTLDDSICHCLEQHLSIESCTQAKIILRCRGDQFPADSCDILCRLIQAAPPSGADFLMLFQAGLEILAGRAEGMSCEECFLKTYRHLLESLRTIREFAKKQDQYGLEYLLMQNYPVPTESEELVLDRLRVVAKITDELLRLQPAATYPLLQRDLGDFTSGQDLDHLFRILS